MNESTRTATIAGLGVALAVIGIYFLPTPPDFTAKSKVNQVLFPDLNDAGATQGMEIVSYDEKLSTRKNFEIKKVNGRWVLPSHKNYPADEKQQLVDAATSLVGLKPLDEVGNSLDQHELYGVIDPTDPKVKVGSIGVGKLVKFKDGGSRTLAQLIIGKQLKETGKENSDSDLRYVRIAGEDPVYTVKLPTDKFSPKFEDWIAKKVLELNTFDIKEVELRDYAVRSDEQGVRRMMKSIGQFDYESKDSKWSLKKFVEFVDEQPVEVTLTDKEELNSAKLNELSSALDNLKIVNVLRKPQSLINSLNEDQIRLDPEAMRSLATRGFYLAQSQLGLQLLARDGEVIVARRDGVEYTLRFGDLDNEIASSDADESKDKNTAPKDAAAVNRYLMVEARFNPDLIPQPMLEEVPAELPPLPSDKKEVPTKEEGKPEEPAKDEPKKVEPKKDEPKTDAEKKDSEKSPDPAKDGQQSSSLSGSPFKTVAFQPPGKQPEEKSSDAKGTDAAKQQAPTESQPATTAAGETKESAAPPAETKPVDPKLDPAARAEAEFERKRIIRENETKQKDYDAKIKAGQGDAKRLNARFAEWYYVIPDDVYRKIHLGKNDLIQRAKPMPGESTNPLKIPGSLQGLQPGFPPPGLMPK